jgi:hypothetical protein
MMQKVEWEDHVSSERVKKATLLRGEINELREFAVSSFSSVIFAGLFAGPHLG